MSNYYIGAGISDVTYEEEGIGLQGFAISKQKSEGVETIIINNQEKEFRLFARTFIIKDSNSEDSIIISVVDIWSCTELVKQKVVRRLKEKGGEYVIYNEKNIMISGTHNHSGPGGYSSYNFYNARIIADTTKKEFKRIQTNVTEAIVSGIVKSIEIAYANLQLGKIYIANGEVDDCGYNRSLDAYNNNDTSCIDRYKIKGSTDKEMLLLKFVGNNNMPIGVLNWYAIHPTDRSQENKKINGDNKGYASLLFEEEMKQKNPNFIAAFANSNCGDVSGNIKPNFDIASNIEQMKSNGEKQFKAALNIFNNAQEELEGAIISNYKVVDMSNVRISGVGKTWTPTIGLSMFAGSTEDGKVYLGLREGIKEGEVSVSERAMQGLILFGVGIQTHAATLAALTPSEVHGHLPKPITLVTGKSKYPITPIKVPIQLFRIGYFTIAGVPGELTTMAGRLLREELQKGLQEGNNSLLPIALSTFSNAYSQYITTKEEYDQQYYEGASTLF